MMKILKKVICTSNFKNAANKRHIEIRYLRLIDKETLWSDLPNLKWKEKETHRQSFPKLTSDDFSFFLFVFLASVEIMASNSW